MMRDKWFICLILFLSLQVFGSSAAADEVKRSFFKVDNLSCGACIRQIDKTLKPLRGYRSMLANIDKKLLAIDHTDVLKESDILAALDSIGKSGHVVMKPEFDPKTTVPSKSSEWRSPSDSLISRILKFF